MEEKLVAPPWKLTGRGKVFIYNLSKDLILENFTFNGDFLGGISVLMLVSYSSSPVGPYDEILFIPGRMRFNEKTGYIISYIRVSTDVSTINGRKNWGIPKETVSLNFDRNKFELVEEKENILIETQSYGISIPVFTHVIPYKLIQFYDGKLFSIRPEATGVSKFAKLKSFQSQNTPIDFLNDKKPIVGFEVPRFRMRFPQPEII